MRRRVRSFLVRCVVKSGESKIRATFSGTHNRTRSRRASDTFSPNTSYYFHGFRSTESATGRMCRTPVGRRRRLRAPPSDAGALGNATASPQIDKNQRGDAFRRELKKRAKDENARNESRCKIKNSTRNTPHFLKGTLAEKFLWPYIWIL